MLEPVESAVRLQQVWRLVRGSRASAKLDAVFEGDSLDGRRVECDEDDFARVTGDIGERLGRNRKLDRCVCKSTRRLDVASGGRRDMRARRTGHGLSPTQTPCLVVYATL